MSESLGECEHCLKFTGEYLKSVPIPDFAAEEGVVEIRSCFKRYVCTLCELEFEQECEFDYNRYVWDLDLDVV